MLLTALTQRLHRHPHNAPVRLTLPLLPATHHARAQFVKEPIEQWQSVGGGPVNLLDLFYKDPARLAYTFQNYVFLTRVLQVRARACARVYGMCVLSCLCLCLPKTHTRLPPRAPPLGAHHVRQHGQGSAARAVRVQRPHGVRAGRARQPRPGRTRASHLRRLVRVGGRTGVVGKGMGSRAVANLSAVAVAHVATTTPAPPCPTLTLPTHPTPPWFYFSSLTSPRHATRHPPRPRPRCRCPPSQAHPDLSAHAGAQRPDLLARAAGDVHEAPHAAGT